MRRAWHGAGVIDYVTIRLDPRRLPGGFDPGRVEFFLKYVLSHPAITIAMQTTQYPAHLADNLAAMRGPLPDRAERREMVRAMERIPGFEDLQNRPWYPGKTFNGQVRLG